MSSDVQTVAANQVTGSAQRHAVMPLLLVDFSVAQAADCMSLGLTPLRLLGGLDSEPAPLVVDMRAAAGSGPGPGHFPGTNKAPVAELEDRLNAG